VDLTPYIVPGGANQLAIRLDNPSDSSRWYPGGGIYRNVWLTKTQPVHIAQWGTYLTTPEVSRERATVKLQVTVDNDSQRAANVSAATEVFTLDAKGRQTDIAVAKIAPASLQIAPVGSAILEVPPWYLISNSGDRRQRSNQIVISRSRLSPKTDKWWIVTKHASAFVTCASIPTKECSSMASALRCAV
jgi:hypothetical protein